MAVDKQPRPLVSDPLLHALAEGIPDPVYLKDRQSRVLMANPATLAVIGKPAEQVIGKTDAEFYDDPAIAAMILENDRRVIEGGWTEVLEETVDTPAGRRVFLSTKSPLRDSNGQVIGLIGVSRDITDRKAVERELRESELRYRQLFEGMDEGYALHEMILDENGRPVDYRFLEVNPAFERLTGLSLKDIIGRTVREVIPDVEPMWIETYGKVVATGKSVRFDGRVESLGRWFEVYAYCPSPNKFGVSFNDISERKAKEEELQKLNRTLKALNDSNEALLHATNEAALLQQVCTIVTRDCGHAMMWIGFAENDDYKTVRPVAYAGFEAGYLETLRISWDDTVRGRGPTGTAIRSGQPCACHDILNDPRLEPWREEGQRRGYASSIALPLMGHDKAFGALTIYASHANAFSEDEIKLLAELAADLAYGIRTLRLRAAHGRMEQVLRQNEEQLRVATSAAEIGVWSWIPGTAQIKVSANWRRLFGIGPDEMVTFETWRNALHPDDRDRAVAELNAASEQNREFNTEYRVPQPDGTVRWIVDRGRATYDENGRSVSMAGINLDITKRKQAEGALQRASDQRRLALEAGELGAWEYRFDTGDVFWDERCSAMFGLSGDAKYEQAMACIHHDDRPSVEFALQNALAGVQGGVYDVEFRVVWSDGSVHWIASHGRVYFEGEGEQRRPVRFIGVNTETSDRKRAQQALIQSEKLASVGRMAATIAHEINNPLAAVINALYLVSVDKSLSPIARQNLTLAEEELDRIAQITKTTLGFYRETTTATVVAMGSIVESVLALYRRKVHEKSIKVFTRYDEANGFVRGSAGELRQVVSNLLANSLDAISPHGEIHVRVTGVTRNGVPMVKLTLADTGAGIGRADLKRIFEAFFTTKASVGTGLGLWVSREIVQKHGGYIRVRSQPGKGTVFCVHLPAPTMVAEAKIGA